MTTVLLLAIARRQRAGALRLARYQVLVLGLNGSGIQYSSAYFSIDQQEPFLRDSDS